jgi:hypothetical protein
MTTFGWHGMVHGDPLPGTAADAYLRPGRSANVTTYDSRLLDGFRFFVQQFANLLSELDSYAEGNGTVLDNSLVILASDLGEGLGHHHAGMGYILAGNLGGAKRNYHLRCMPEGGDYWSGAMYEVVQLLNSICDMAGVQINNAPVSMGLQGYLAKVGRPRRIDALF